MKIFVVVGGPNGSGKTTLTERNEKKDGITYLNPDEIQKQIATGNTEADIVKAGRLTLEKANDLLEKGESILIESTLSGKAHLKLLKKAKDLGYKTRIDFVCLQSAALNVKRVSDRVKNGGHNVPKNRYKTPLQKGLRDTAKIPQARRLFSIIRQYRHTHKSAAHHKRKA